MAITRKGLKFLLAGVIVIAAGLVLMIGGASDNPQVFNWGMFDFRKTVAAPVVILSGIAVCIIAIMGCRNKGDE